MIDKRWYTADALTADLTNHHHLREASEVEAECKILRSIFEVDVFHRLEAFVVWRPDKVPELVHSLFRRLRLDKQREPAKPRPLYQGVPSLKPSNVKCPR